MRRLLLSTLVTVLTLAGLYAGNAVASPDPVVTIRTTYGNPAEIDRMIGVFTERLDRTDHPYLPAAILGELYFERARITSDQADYDRALRHLGTAYDIDPQPGTAILLARAQLAVHDFSSALATIRTVPAGTQVTAVESISFDAHLGLGQPGSAAARLRTLESLHPDEPAIVVRRAELAFLTGSADRAVRASLAALEVAGRAELGDADMAFYRTAAARYLLAVGDADRALDLARDAVDTLETDPGAWLMLARAEAATGALVEAVSTAERAAELRPHPAALAFLADLHLALGNTEAAVRQLETIDAIAALDQTAYRRDIALARSEHGRSLTAALAAARAEVAERGDPYAHHLMATVLHALGRPDEAEEHARIAMTVADPAVLFRAGMVALDDRHPGLALSRLQAAVRAAPDFHPIHAATARAVIEELEQ